MIPNKGEFDPDALQAQIDLSLSLAQDIVSSWLHPSYKVSKNSKITDKELEEYMRQPPRLGVGASVPQCFFSNTREAARLKGRIITSSKKRGREELEKEDSDFDETEENKGGRSSKGISIDPFGPIGKFKQEKVGTIVNSKIKNSSADEYSKRYEEHEMKEISQQRHANSTVQDNSEKESVDNKVSALSESSSPILPVKKGKKKIRRKKKMISLGDTVKADGADENTNIQLDNDTQTRLNNESDNLTEEEEWSGILPDDSLAEHNIPLTFDQSSSYLESLMPSKRLKLLNLDGQPPESNLATDENNGSHVSKRKRRRRKKRH